MTSSNGSFAALLAFFVGNSSVISDFPSQRASNADFDGFFYCGTHKQLNKQSNDRRFEITWRSCDVIVMQCGHVVLKLKHTHYIIWCNTVLHWTLFLTNCPACRTTLVATRFRVAVICPIIQVPHCIRVFFYFVWFVFINHIFQFYYELCTYCNILDIYLS